MRARAHTHTQNIHTQAHTPALAYLWTHTINKLTLADQVQRKRQTYRHRERKRDIWKKTERQNDTERERERERERDRER